jgi:hypothetical protein
MPELTPGLAEVPDRSSSAQTGLSDFALGSAVVVPQFAKADTATSKPWSRNAGIYRLKLSAFEVTVLSDGSFTLPCPLLATNFAEADLKEFGALCSRLPQMAAKISDSRIGLRAGPILFWNRSGRALAIADARNDSS